MNCDDFSEESFEAWTASGGLPAVSGNGRDFVDGRVGMTMIRPPQSSPKEDIMKLHWLVTVALGAVLAGCGPTEDNVSEDIVADETPVSSEEGGPVTQQACVPAGYYQYGTDTSCDYGNGYADIGCFCNPGNPYEMTIFCGRYINRQKVRYCFKSDNCSSSCGSWSYTGQNTYTYKSCSDYGCR
ncbi:hypothetical protein [Hyalangium gracile]|uniref:hypothetical protein n=1 Tax=Hyalangium gracile TaxID=394092 RepID=UPI001CCBDEE7|nr:hypothetical protein [Hyalangium gracile]